MTLLILILPASQTGRAMDIPASQQFARLGDVVLTSGATLRDVSIGYRTAGKLNEYKSNILIFPTWFTGSTAFLFESGLIGPGKLADTNTYYVVAIDALGNGVSTSPSNSPDQPGHTFPDISIADMVSSQHQLLTKHLDIQHVKAIVGESMGGMQVFQWMGQYPEFMDMAVPIDGYPKPTSYDLLQWTTHESAIEMLHDLGASNRSITDYLARLNLLTLWTPTYFVTNVSGTEIFNTIAAEQKDYHRLHAYDYLAQLRAMMNLDVYSIYPNGQADYIGAVSAQTLVIGVPSDQMVNPNPGKVLADALNAAYLSIDSDCGHMGTTCEAVAVAKQVNHFLSGSSERRP